MAYAELYEVKQYLGIGDQTSDDVILSDLIARAQSVIEAYTGRSFEAIAATRYFTTDNITSPPSSTQPTRRGKLTN